MWCIIEDFNCVCKNSERVGASQRDQGSGVMREFTAWLKELEVEDVPCVGRDFTRYRPNGVAKNRLDRILVSHAWFAKWQGSAQYIMDRNFSDHCPVLLKINNVDWGPKS